MSNINTSSQTISPSNYGNSESKSSKTSLSKFAEDFDDFLTLLITQLKNQDPTAPMDSKQFTDQIVQFTSVEQSINTNQKLDKLIEATSLSQTSNLLSIVGKQVEFEGGNVNISDENKTADIKFTANPEDENIFIRIVAQGGKVVKTDMLGKNNLTNGENIYQWDGKDNNGNKLNNGNYKVEFTKINKVGNVEKISTVVSGVASGANLMGAEQLILVNGMEIPFKNIRFVKDM